VEATDLMATIRIQLDEQSKRVIERHARRPARLLELLTQAHAQALAETESYVKANKLSGQDLRVRSGSLRQAITHKADGPLSGWVGVTRGPASAYARVQLGSGRTTITPKKANHLWIPVADNLTRSGRARISPREAMEMRGPRGGRLLSIFMSKRGNLVAVLRDGHVPGVRRGGGKLLFVLKKSVTIEGTDALAEGVEEMRPRILDLLRGAMARVEDN